MPCGKSGCNCDHSAADLVSNAKEAYGFHKYIDLQRVNCLNEEQDGSARKIFKEFDDRFDIGDCLLSDADAELLLTIPFTGVVKLHGILVAGPNDDGSHPKTLRLFKDCPQLSFEEANAKTPEQIISVHSDPTISLEAPLKAVKFNNVSSLTIHFSSNQSGDDDEITKVSYIGLRGEFLAPHPKNSGIVITAYESRANPADHKNPADNATHQDIM